MPFYATKRLMRTADDKVVAEDDPAAAFLFASEGDAISDEDAERYGITAKTAGVSSSNPAAKQAEQTEDKAVDPPANKGRTRK